MRIVFMPLGLLFVACWAITSPTLNAQELPSDWPDQIEVVNHPKGRSHDGVYFRDPGTINGAPYYSHENQQERPGSLRQFDYIYRMLDIENPNGVSYVWVLQSVTPHPARFEGDAFSTAVAPWEGGWDHEPLQVTKRETERSNEVNAPPVKVVFSNPLDEQVKVIWVDYEGVEKEWDKLAPGESYEQESGVDHYWKFFVGDQQVGCYRTTRRAGQSYAVGVAEASGIAPPQRPAGPRLETVRVRLNNAYNQPLGVLVIDKRSPETPLPLQIEPRSFAMCDLSLPVNREGDRTAIYEMSVYDLSVRSVSIDRSGRGGATTRTVTPRSIGHFPVPSGLMNQGSEIDVYASASRRNNPGAVVRVDPAIWTSTQVSKPPSPPQPQTTLQTNTPPIPIDPPQTPLPPAPTPIREWSDLLVDSDYADTGVTATGLDCALAQVGPSGDLTIQRTIWEGRSEEYTVSVPYTEQVEETYTANGEERVRIVPVSKTRVETRIRTVSVPKMISETLPAGKYRTFSASGRQLSPKEPPLVFKNPSPVIVLRPGASLDRAYLEVLQDSAKIIVDDRTADAARFTAAAPQELASGLPAWPVFCISGAYRADGSLRVVCPQLVSEEKTVSYTVSVPVTKQIDGRSITEYIPEEKTKTILQTVRVPEDKQIPQEGYRAYQMSGKRLAADALAKALEERRLLLYIKPDDKISRSFHGSLFRDDCVVVTDRRKPNEALPVWPDMPQ